MNVRLIRRMLKAGIVAILFGILSSDTSDTSEAGEASSKIPVIYCTDLFHPHDDPDDHFDLATLYSIPEFDLRGIVLDQGDKQLLRPGKIPVSQLNALSGRHVPTAIGLKSKLKSPSDGALDQESQFQSGVGLILSELHQATSRVDIVAVGSVRDLVAAFNREPGLFRQKAGRIMVFIGDAANHDYREYNVELDPNAFVGLMRSGLNIYWVPCFDGGLWHNAGHASFWQATHAALLAESPPALIQYFIYALEKETADPIHFLWQPVAAGRREQLLKQTRSLWCAAVFRSLATRGVVEGKCFTFEPVEVMVGDDATIQYSGGKKAKRLRRFCVRDRAQFASGMTRETAECLAHFPIQSPARMPATAP
jgi:hypothetical protein